MATADKNRVIKKLETDKVFLLAMLRDPASALKEYDYKLGEADLRKLTAITEREVKYIGEKYGGMINIQGRTGDKELALSLVDDPIRATNKIQLRVPREKIANLDKLSTDLQRHAIAALKGGIAPVADNFCEGCNGACSGMHLPTDLPHMGIINR
jgi:hypothetical protein